MCVCVCGWVGMCVHVYVSTIKPTTKPTMSTELSVFTQLSVSTKPTEYSVQTEPSVFTEDSAATEPLYPPRSLFLLSFLCSQCHLTRVHCAFIEHWSLLCVRVLCFCVCVCVGGCV